MQISNQQQHGCFKPAIGIYAIAEFMGIAIYNSNEIPLVTFNGCCGRCCTSFNWFSANYSLCHFPGWQPPVGRAIRIRVRIPWSHGPVVRCLGAPMETECETKQNPLCRGIKHFQTPMPGTHCGLF